MVASKALADSPRRLSGRARRAPAARAARPWWVGLTLLAVLTSAGGCGMFRNEVLISQMPAEGPSPRELNKISLPAYRVEPPDVLLIDAVKVVPKPPYHVEPLDVLQVFVLGTLPDQPITGNYPVEADGTIMLGPAYGSVKVTGLTLAEAREAVTEHLKNTLTAPEVSVSLAESAGKQQISGEHLVGPDGTVNLGVYGSVYVAGMTLGEAREAIEAALSEFLDEPEVAVDVFAYNSKVYYVVTEGAGMGDQLQRVPITGNETVLDAISAINGLSRVSSKTIWVARPAPPDGSCCAQILPVNWRAIVDAADTSTNWQLLPGDRVFVAEDKLIALDTLVDKLVGPFERLVGFNLLTFQTIQTANRFPLGFSTGSAGF
jgi:polysaccharide export outer membrane protein